MVLQICSSPKKVPYAASRAAAIFNCLLLASFSLCAVFVVYSVAMIQPSSSCGPFRNVDCENQYVYVYVQRLVQHLPTKFSHVRKFVYVLLLQDRIEFFKNVDVFIQVVSILWGQTFQYCLLCGFSLYLYVLMSNAFAQRGLKNEQNKDWQSLKALNSDKWDVLTEAVKKAFAYHSTQSATEEYDQ